METAIKFLRMTLVINTAAKNICLKITTIINQNAIEHIFV